MAKTADAIHTAWAVSASYQGRKHDGKGRKAASEAPRVKLETGGKIQLPEDGQSYMLGGTYRSHMGKENTV